MNHKLLLIISSISISAFLGCSNQSQDDIPQASIKSKTPNVRVVNPSFRTFISELQIIGNATPNKQVDLYAMEGGFLKTVKKEIGDKVWRGDVLAILENPELQRKLEIDRVAKQVAESNYRRIKESYDWSPELTTTSDFEKAEAKYLMAKAKYQATKNRDSLLIIRAPFKGVVTQRNFDQGALIESGMNSSRSICLFEIMDTEVIRLVIALPETEVDNISIGMKAKINFSELPNQEFDSRISRMADAINNKTKTMEVQFDIDNKDLRITAGMYANVSLELESSKDKLSLPTEALIAIKSEYFLLKVEKGIVKRVLIKKGLYNAKYFEILSSEINEKSEIIIEGKSLVKEGMKVKFLK